MSALKTVVLLNLKFTAQEPGFMLLSPLATNGRVSSLVMVMLLSVGAYVGIARSVRRGGCQPLHAIFPVYLAMLVWYPFSQPGRFLLPFAPLLLVGVWVEGRAVWKTVAGRVMQSCGRDERAAAWVLGLGALALAGLIAVNYYYALPRAIRGTGKQHELVFADEEGAFGWIRQHTSPDARIIANEDRLVYLSTGRPSVFGVVDRIEAVYFHSSRHAESDAAHLADIARHVGASFWMTTPYDYLLETRDGRALLLRREKELLATAPIVFRSADGRVTLYDTRCLWAGPGRDCRPEDVTGGRDRSSVLR